MALDELMFALLRRAAGGTAVSVAGRGLRTLRHLLAILVLAPLAILALPAKIASAQGTPKAPGAQNTNPEQEALFQRIIKEPANLDVTFQHAELASKNGDFEAAIGSLERMLFFNPNLPRVMLELGVLYFRLGSYEMSREYFQKVIAAPDTPAEVRARVEPYLAEIEKRLSPILTTAFIQSGLRYQTNANAGPNGALVRVFGFDAQLDSQFAKAKDWNGFTQGVWRNIIDFGNQRGDAWETTISFYATRQFEFSRLNTELVDAQTGPRIAILPDRIAGLSVRPYIGVTGIRLDNHNYLSAQTAGAAVLYSPAPGWAIEAGYERMRRNFHDSTNYQTVELQSGYTDVAYGNLSGLLFGGWSWGARGMVAEHIAYAEWQSYSQRGADLYLTYATSVPIYGNQRRLALIPFVGYLETNYKEPDFFVDPDVKRQDRERKAGGAIDLQITDHIGIGLKLQFSRNQSSIPNYEYDNLSVFGGPTFRF